MMITKDRFEKVRETARHCRAMVIGDVMLDRYLHGVVDRISPEAPVPVVNLQKTEMKAGGAANVALNLAAWGCQTGLIGLVGHDAAGEALKNIMSGEGISHFLVSANDRPTTVKTRVVAASHHLIRIDEESRLYLQDVQEFDIIQDVLRKLEHFKPNLIIFEDYNKGFLTNSLIQAVIDFGKKNNVFIAVDPKETNFFAYRGADLFKPNQREATEAAGRRLSMDELQQITKEWSREYEYKLIAVTLGADGVFMAQNGDSLQVWPNTSVEVLDVCGAGDGVICALALGAMAGLSLEENGTLGNLCGAYICSHSGVVAVNVEEIYHWI